MNHAEFRQYADREDAGELVDGVELEEKMGSLRHESTAAFVLGLLLTWARQQKGLALGSDHPIQVSETRARKPDVTLYVDRTARGVPDLVIEVLSSGPSDRRRDLVDKRREYAERRIPRYLVLDPVGEVAMLFTLGEDGYGTAPAKTASGGKLAIDMGERPAVVVDLDELWTEIADLPVEEP